MLVPLFGRVTQLCPSTTETAIESDQVPPGEFWVVTGVFVYNGSTESFTVKIGVERGTQFIPYQYNSALATLAVEAPVTQPMLGEGEKLVAKCTGSSAGGLITLMFNGFRYKIVDPVRP